MALERVTHALHARQEADQELKAALRGLDSVEETREAVCMLFEARMRPTDIAKWLNVSRQRVYQLRNGE